MLSHFVCVVCQFRYYSTRLRTERALPFPALAYTVHAYVYDACMAHAPSPVYLRCALIPVPLERYAFYVMLRPFA